jgi:hypothetical protein
MDICVICHCSCELNRFCKNCKYYIHKECFEKWYYSKKLNNNCFICKSEIKIAEKNKLAYKTIVKSIEWIYMIIVFLLFAFISRYINDHIFFPNIIEVIINTHLITKHWNVIKNELRYLISRSSNNAVDIFLMITYVFVILSFLKFYVYINMISFYIKKEEVIDDYIKKKLVSIKIIF